MDGAGLSEFLRRRVSALKEFLTMLAGISYYIVKWP